MNHAVLCDITVYPVKSTAGLAQAAAWVEAAGLSFDRRFLLSLPDGTMVTARKYPQLLQVTTVIRPDALVLSYPGLPTLVLEYAGFAMTPVTAQVWRDSFSAFKTTDLASDWFAQIIAEPVQLLYLGGDSRRIGGKAGVPVSFADGFPLLLISQASLEAVNAASPVHHVMAQFRPNLVVSGVAAFAEDSWQRFRIGEVTFEAREPCSRCILTTVDPLTGQRRPLQEPLTTLARFRKGANGRVHFGQNLVPLNEGIIRQGDTLEVLAEKQPEIYLDHRNRHQGY